jgi:plastocyanin
MFRIRPAQARKTCIFAPASLTVKTGSTVTWTNEHGPRTLAARKLEVLCQEDSKSDDEVETTAAFSGSKRRCLGSMTVQLRAVLGSCRK